MIPVSAMSHANHFSSSSSSSSSFLELQEEDIHTVTTFKSPSGQSITLIGTAHLSQRSNEQVQRLIQDIQPNMLLVELDPSRLSRIGIRSLDEIQIPRIVSADDIQLPAAIVASSSLSSSWIGWMFRPFWMMQEALTEAFSRIARALLTGMYKDMSDKINNPRGGGGEFLVAIRAAEQVSACTTLVLGDRSSITTIKRAATLAIQSGDPLGVLQRLQDANSQEMSQLEQQVRAKLQAAIEQEQGGGGSGQVEEAQVSITMMETLKEDSQFRNRLFRKLEQQVPEFTQAFLKERDYIMAEAIRRELESDATLERVVGVVGLAHVSGVQETLQAMFTNDTIPLLRSVLAE